MFPFGGINASSTWIAGEVVLAMGCIGWYWEWMVLAAFLTISLLIGMRHVG